MKLKLPRLKSANQKGFGHVELLIAIIAIGAVAFIGIRVLTATRASSGCGVNVASLLNTSCPPLVGTSAGQYPQTGGLSQLQFAEARLNNPSVTSTTASAKTVALTKHFDIMHIYNSAGSNSLTSEEISYAKRANTVLIVNWKPANPWSKAGGSDAAANLAIKQMADSIKAIAPIKIVLVIWHEPENDVSPGGDSNCPQVKYIGQAGTVAQYVAMWHNTRAIFDQEGVHNVVWDLNYMGFPKWDCLVPDLYPGNSYIDMVSWDRYGNGATGFTASTQSFYTTLTKDSTASNNFLSKPWGLTEFGNSSGTETEATNYWTDATNAVKNNTFPKLRFFSAYDSKGTGDSRVGLDYSGAPNVGEQTAFNNFVKYVESL